MVKRIQINFENQTTINEAEIKTRWKHLIGKNFHFEWDKVIK